MKKILLILLLLVTLTGTVSAENIEATATGTHIVGGTETQHQAEEAAVGVALRNCAEMIGVKVISYTETHNHITTRDDIYTFTSATIQVKSKTVAPKLEGGVLIYEATVTGVVNLDDLENWEPRKVSELPQESNVIIEDVTTMSGTLTEDTFGLTAQANNLIGMGNFTEAYKLVDDAIRRGQNNSELWFMRGNLLYQERKYSLALADFNKAYDLTPTVKTLKKIGDCLYQEGQYQEALGCYQECVKYAPEWSAVNSNIGACYWSLDRPEVAVNWLLKGARLANGGVEKFLLTITENQWDIVTGHRKKLARKVLPLA